MKSLIILILCVVCGVMATSSKIIQDPKVQAGKNFLDSIKRGKIEYAVCKQSAANQKDCLATYYNTFRIAADKLKSVLNPKEIDKINKDLTKLPITDPLNESLIEANYDLSF